MASGPDSAMSTRKPSSSSHSLMESRTTSSSSTTNTQIGAALRAADRWRRSDRPFHTRRTECRRRCPPGSVGICGDRQVDRLAHRQPALNRSGTDTGQTCAHSPHQCTARAHQSRLAGQVALNLPASPRVRSIGWKAKFLCFHGTDPCADILGGGVAIDQRQHLAHAAMIAGKLIVELPEGASQVRARSMSVTR